MNGSSDPDIHSRLQAHIDRVHDLRDCLRTAESLADKTPILADDYPAGAAFIATLKALRADLWQANLVEIKHATALFDGDSPMASTTEAVLEVLAEKVARHVALMEEAFDYLFP